jgi:hypothetical protein
MDPAALSILSGFQINYHVPYFVYSKQKLSNNNNLALLLAILL